MNRLDTETKAILQKTNEPKLFLSPTDLIHRIGIAPPAEKIYYAITTEEGIHGC